MTFDDQFTPEEYDVIQQLRNDPRPKIKQQVVDTLRQQVFAEMDTLFPLSPQPKPPLPIVTLIGVMIAILVIIIVIVIVSSVISAPKQELPQLTSTVPSEVVTPTLLPTPEADATNTNEPTIEATQTQAIVPISTPLPIATDDDTIIIIEGPVQAISVNIITIFNINVQVDSNDPILTQVQIGDNVRVEGHAVPQGNTIIIIAVNVTIVNVIIVNPPQGGSPGLPPGCKITPKGHIKCTKKNR